MSVGWSLADIDGSESLSVLISGIPSAATLLSGETTLTPVDGAVSVTQAQLAGLKLVPAFNSDADFTLGVTATSTESGGGSVTTMATLAVTVNAVADAPNLTVSAATGTEHTTIALSVASSLVDGDGSETLSVVITGIPSGATMLSGATTLTQVSGRENLTQEARAGLKLVPAAKSDEDFTLGVTATSTETAGGSATTTAALAVTVNAVADAPNLTVSAATGNEDTTIALSLASSLADIDGSESLSVLISGIPSGATLLSGTTTLTPSAGAVNVTPAQLAGLKLVPAANSDADFMLGVTATSTETAGGSATTTAALAVTVNAVADAPNLTVSAATGNEDTAIALAITTSVTDPSETITGVTISGVPNGASLSAGTSGTGGVWTLSEGQLEGLTITPPSNSSDAFTLTVTSTSTDGSVSASTSATLA
ncbi:MAG: hypothetical protein ACK5UV_00955, partial [bacterium]